MPILRGGVVRIVGIHDTSKNTEEVTALPIMDGTLVKFEPNGKFVDLITYNRAHGGKKRFLIMAEELSAWLTPGIGMYFEKDIGHHLFITRNGGNVRIKVLWYHDTQEVYTRFVEQVFTLPLCMLEAALAGNAVHHLCCESRAYPKARPQMMYGVP